MGERQPQHIRIHTKSQFMKIKNTVGLGGLLAIAMLTGALFTNINAVASDATANGTVPGWYKSPPGTVADVAPEAGLKRYGIELPKDLPKTAARLTPKNEVWCGVPPAKPTLLAKNQINGRIQLQ